MRYPKYDDGLDADGYPAKSEPWRKPYVHGSEADVGDFKPASLGGAFSKVVERAAAAMKTSETADSPIETVLGAAIILRFREAGKPLTLCSPTEIPSNADGLLFVPQFKWIIYRSDWAIYNPRTTGALLIECDGKEFHTGPERVAHDQKKDQAAQDLGFLTMRFSGSRIHRNADEIAREIYDFVYGGKK